MNLIWSLSLSRKDSDKLVKITLLREAAKKVTLGPDNLPSICFYSVLNAHVRYCNEILPDFIWGRLVAKPYIMGLFNTRPK